MLYRIYIKAVSDGSEAYCHADDLELATAVIDTLLKHDTDVALVRLEVTEDEARFLPLDGAKCIDHAVGPLLTLYRLMKAVAEAEHGEAMDGLLDDANSMSDKATEVFPGQMSLDEAVEAEGR